MRKLVVIITLAGVAACWSSPVLARDGAIRLAQMEDPTAPQEAPAIPKDADLTGQMIYTSTGNTVGKVSAMKTDAKGERVAVVSTEQRLGIGGTSILFPISKLQPREKGGGYMTNMTQAQVRQLPKAEMAAE